MNRVCPDLTISYGILIPKGIPKESHSPPRDSNCPRYPVSKIKVDRTGKTSRSNTRQSLRPRDTLPTRAETYTVGQAIIDYLRVRPSTSERRVFVRQRRPVGEAITSCAVGIALRRAFKRARLDAPSMGTHILRHMMATNLIRKGASLKEFADVLKHRHIDTTFIYTKVNVSMLAQIAMPWPKVER